jgi:hypothetical protein
MDEDERVAIPAQAVDVWDIRRAAAPIVAIPAQAVDVWDGRTHRRAGCPRLAMEWQYLPKRLSFGTQHEDV